MFGENAGWCGLIVSSDKALLANENCLFQGVPDNNRFYLFVSYTPHASAIAESHRSFLNRSEKRKAYLGKTEATLLTG